ncbi:MAG: GNAT family N-acetyltransferase [Trueperaceae bacterium]|nr:GNAT family N-acetyltransferase [Trueperaceae bacterium]
MDRVVVEPLAWDSDFWGFPVGMVLAEPGDARGDDDVARELDRFRVVQAQVDLARAGAARELASHGFFPVDNRLEHELDLRRYYEEGEAREHAPTPPGATWLTSMERSEARAYAEQLLPQSRFNAFPVPASRIVDFYELWIEKAQAGAFDDGLLHLKIDGASAGFASTRLRDGVLTMGLIGVDTAFRGGGVFELLLDAMLAGARRDGARSVTMTTEGINLAARRSFARHGFRLTRDRLWMYRIR